MSRIRLRLVDEGEGDDPLLSMVNLIDVFLVLVAALLLALARHGFLDADQTALDAVGPGV